jgi:hypothetical protein
MVRRLVSILSLGAVVAGAAAGMFTPGNLVVTRFGDGSASLGTTATATFLDEYTPSGTLVQTIPMPTAVGAYGRALTNSGSATSEGFLTRSVDGRYLTLMGYDAAPGTAAIAATLSTNVNRIVGRVDALGVYDTTTALSDAYSASNPRSAVSTNGTDLWLTGNGSPTSSAGVRYTTFGSATSTQLSTTPTNVRVANIFGGQLYTSSASGAFQGVSAVGTGLPTTSGQTTTLLPGFPTASGPSSYDYYFADASTLYVADDRAAPNGGIQKWLFNGTTWALSYTLTGTNGVRGLTGTTDGLGNTVLYGTMATSPLTSLVTVTDLGVSSTFTTIATAGTNTAFRGVEFAPIPEPASLLLAGLGAAVVLRRRR